MSSYIHPVIASLSAENARRLASELRNFATPAKTAAAELPDTPLREDILATVNALCAAAELAMVHAARVEATEHKDHESRMLSAHAVGSGISPAAMARLCRMLEQPSTGLAYVPEVVRACCEAGWMVKDAREQLLAANLEGLVELRPESGLGRLPTADLELCPRIDPSIDPCETPLTWARVLPAHQKVAA